MIRRLISHCTIIAFVTAVGFHPTSSAESTDFVRGKPFYYTNRQYYIAPPPETNPTSPEASLGASNPEVITHGSRERKLIALTFDADMNPYMKRLHDEGKVKSWYNKDVITALEETQTPATLFLTGMWIEMYPKVTKELAANPLFELANHSYSHPSFDGACYGLSHLADKDDETEIQKTQILLRIYTGVDNKYFRFPGGCYGKKDLEVVSQLGLQTIHWDVVGNDGFSRSPEKIEQNILSRVQNGSIIVLHMHGGPNAPETGVILPTIIKSLRAEGYAFVKVSELLQN